MKNQSRYPDFYNGGLMFRRLILWSVSSGVILIGCSPVVKQLSALQKSDVETRRKAAFQISTFEQVDQKYLSRLVEATYDKDATVREFAIKAVGKMDPHWEGVNKTIIRGLHDPDLNVRRASAAIFSTMNPVPAEVLYSLAETLADKDSVLRSFVHSTFVDLGSIGVNALMRTCKSKNDTVRCRAIVTLGTIGCEAKIALPVLKSLLEDENDQIRSAARNSIERIELSYVCPSNKP